MGRYTPTWPAAFSQAQHPSLAGSHSHLRGWRRGRGAVGGLGPAPLRVGGFPEGGLTPTWHAVFSQTQHSASGGSHRHLLWGQREGGQSHGRDEAERVGFRGMTGGHLLKGMGLRSTWGWREL